MTKIRSIIAIALPAAPILLVLLWHLSNHALPADDAANHAATAVRIAKQFDRQQPFSGVAAVLNTRGFRPIFFPPLAVPFLLLTGNDVVAACAATLLLIYLAFALYMYLVIHLCTDDPLTASAACTAIISMPLIAYYSLVFFSELAWLLFSVACVYHLLRSGPFRVVGHAAVAGLWGGLMVAIRPAESVLVLAVVLAFQIVPAILSKVLVLRGILIALGLFSIPAGLLLLSGWAKGITRWELWVFWFFAVVLSILLAGRQAPSFVAFLGALTSVCCIWWAGFMPAMLSWAYVAREYSITAQVTSVRSLEQIAHTLLKQAQDYGEVQLAALAGLTIFLMVSAILTAKRRGATDSLDPTATPFRRLLYASSILLVPFVVLYSGGGSDRRRSLLAIVLFALPVMALAAKRSRIALAAIFCLIAVQLTVMASDIAGAPVGAALNGFGIPVPHRGPDGNLDTARALLPRISQGNAVAVYTLALFHADARIYEPNALKLACIQESCGFDVGYFWNVGDYDEVITRLRQANFKYLLLDSFSEVGPTAIHEPYVHFAVELLRRIQAGTETPGLQAIARFQIGGRNQTLFRVLLRAPPSGSNNLAADWTGSMAIATEQQRGFPASNLNDGTAAPWGSLEGTSDVYAGVVLSSPHAINEMRLQLFTPSGRPHLRDIRIVTADVEGRDGPSWKFVRARLKGSNIFANVVTVPPLPDGSEVTIEVDHKDPYWRSHPMWGFACLRSRGDLPNYLTVGTGVFVRELEVQ